MQTVQHAKQTASATNAGASSARAHTHTHTHTQTHIHTLSLTYSNTHSHTQTHKHTLSHLHKHTYRHTLTHTHRRNIWEAPPDKVFKRANVFQDDPNQCPTQGEAKQPSQSASHHLPVHSPFLPHFFSLDLASFWQARFSRPGARSLFDICARVSRGTWHSLVETRVEELIHGPSKKHARLQCFGQPTGGVNHVLQAWRESRNSTWRESRERERARERERKREREREKENERERVCVCV